MGSLTQQQGGQPYVKAMAPYYVNYRCRMDRIASRDWSFMNGLMVGFPQLPFRPVENCRCLFSTQFWNLSSPCPSPPRGHEEAANVSRGSATGQNSGFSPREIMDRKDRTPPLVSDMSRRDESISVATVKEHSGMRQSVFGSALYTP